MARKKIAVVELEPPEQPCKYCGQLLTLTRESYARFKMCQKTGEWNRGFFYTCFCSDDLQPMERGILDAVKAN